MWEHQRSTGGAEGSTLHFRLHLSSSKQHCNYHSLTNGITHSALISASRSSFCSSCELARLPAVLLRFSFSPLAPVKSAYFTSSGGAPRGPPGAPSSHQSKSFSVPLLRRGRHFISPNDGGCHEGCRGGKRPDSKNRLLRRSSEMMHVRSLARTEEEEGVQSYITPNRP